MQIKGLCTGLALLLCAGLYAQNAESDFETDGQGTITKYAGWDAAVVIPAHNRKGDDRVEPCPRSLVSEDICEALKKA
jgi:hypothetical protein